MIYQLELMRLLPVGNNIGIAAGYQFSSIAKSVLQQEFLL